MCKGIRNRNLQASGESESKNLKFAVKVELVSWIKKLEERDGGMLSRSFNYCIRVLRYSPGVIPLASRNVLVK